MAPGRDSIERPETREEISSLSAEQLKAATQRHTDAMMAQFGALRERLRREYRPTKLLRRHPVLAVALGGLAALFLLRIVRGRRRKAAEGRRRAAPPESPPEAFGRSFASSTARMLGSLLPGILFMGMSRRGRRGGGRGP